VEECGPAQVANNLKPELIETQATAVVQQNRMTSGLRILDPEFHLELVLEAIIGSPCKLLHSVVQHQYDKQVSVREI
jgi:hypothetical protein